MSPELWTLVGAVAVALIAAGSAGYSAKTARSAQRETSESSPYDALASRVVHLENRVESLEHELEATKDRAARAAAAFRERIHVLMTHIDRLTQYAEILLDVIRLKQIPFVDLPEMPVLPEGKGDTLP